MKCLDNEQILYVDNHLLIVLKEADLLTQTEGDGRLSLEELAKAWVKQEFHKPGSVFLTPTHRLDLPVSGLVLFARTSKALSRLNAQMREQRIQRIYHAEVEGVLAGSEGRLDHYLLHADHYAKVVDSETPNAKHARLTYRVLEHKEHTTLVEVELDTGRYHQIRAQFSAIGHPIVGDARYRASETKRDIHLHGAKISFEHPVTKELLTFSSTAPFI